MTKSHRRLPRTGKIALLSAARAGVLAAALVAGLDPECGAETPEPLRSWKKGAIDCRSIQSLAFGPKGILFVGDVKAGRVYAVETGDETPKNPKSPPEIENIGRKLASRLGVEPEDLRIWDLTLNPISRTLYLAISAA